jgi:hypothetical protein
MPINVKKLVGHNGYSPTCMVSCNVANVAGGGAGASVTVDLTTAYRDQYSNGVLPSDGNYAVIVTPSQAATANVTGKTASGFSVVLTPVLSSATLAAGTFDLIVHS